MWRVQLYFSKIAKFLSIIFFFPLSLIFFLGIIFIKPFFKVRISKFRSDKLGHLSLDYEIYLEEKSRNINTPKNKYIDLWVKDNIICNKYLYNIRKSQIKLLPNYIFKGVMILFQFFRFKEFFIERENPDADIHYVLDNSKTRLTIEKEEEFNLKNKKILEQNGYNENLKIILLNIRDTAYRGPSKFTDYRNIYKYENYNDTIKYLINKNYFVIRVGRAAKFKFEFKENFIDYPFSKIMSDQMDLYLAKVCNFCISTGAGFDGLVRSFRNPVLFTNFLPYGYFNSFGEKNMTIFKHLIDEDGKRISLNRMLEMNIINNLDGNFFLKNKISFEENSSYEILEATKSMIDNIKNNYKKEKSELDKLVEEFYTIKILNKYGKTHHKKINSKICSNFLVSNSYLFDL